MATMDYSQFSPFDYRKGQWLSSIPASTKQIGAFVNKLKKATNSAVITALGDSTGASATGWLIKLVRDKIGPAFPSYSVQSRLWSDADQKYEDSATTLQTGSLGLRRFVCTGASTDRFFTIPDSASTSPVGDIDARFKILIPALGDAFSIGGKYDTATNNRAWFGQINAGGTISLFFSTDGLAGTQVTRTSTASLPAGAIGVPVWIRITLDVDNGAAGHTVNFYYSTDNTNWTQVGTSVVTAGVTSIFNAATATQFNSRGGGGQVTVQLIEYYAFQLFDSLVAGARPVIDMDASLWNGYGSNLRAGGSNIAQFTDFVGNTVQIDGTGQTGSIVGSPTLFLLNGCVSGQAIAYANDGVRFPKLTPTTSDLAIINYSHNEVGTVYYRTAYKQLADAIIAKWADVGIIGTAQNPRKSPAINITEHVIRIDQINALTASQGYALIDAYNLLSADLSLVSSDGIHPTDIGYDAISTLAYRLFSVWT